ncbi:helix-turn-helix transcriptional regulator [Erysipelothrix enhydrae]|uniref:helix-turn-helix transcriptional regulator n=1 Tax=Erysipelothrix enhydrae TaxID=2890314 RepID=UPI002B24F572|nr:helix-turn-helix transcriptional regulator [Erysipelothrix sp. 4322-04]WRB87101.1 helix-turn-helix transcriptional regulator [Erysipelothrix sp. 4322-04]
MILNHIRDKREELGYTQQYFAEQVGVSRQTVIALEKGFYNPSLELAFKCAIVLNCTLDVLFQYEENPL